MCPEEPDLSTGTVVFALLLNKSAIGIYTTHQAAKEAWTFFNKGASREPVLPDQTLSNWTDRQ